MLSVICILVIWLFACDDSVGFGILDAVALCLVGCSIVFCFVPIRWLCCFGVSFDWLLFSYVDFCV